MRIKFIIILVFYITISNQNSIASNIISKNFNRNLIYTIDQYANDVHHEIKGERETIFKDEFFENNGYLLVYVSQPKNINLSSDQLALNTAFYILHDKRSAYRWYKGSVKGFLKGIKDKNPNVKLNQIQGLDNWYEYISGYTLINKETNESIGTSLIIMHDRKLLIFSVSSKPLGDSDNIKKILSPWLSSLFSYTPIQ